MQSDLTTVIVSENAAKRFWPGQDPIGKRIKGGGPTSNAPWMTIDRRGERNEVSRPAGQSDQPIRTCSCHSTSARRQFSLLVRTPLEPGPLAAAVRGALRQAEPSAVIYNVSTLRSSSPRKPPLPLHRLADDAVRGRGPAACHHRAYGVMSTRRRRTQEIGIRMALGAARGQVLRSGVVGGMALIAAGLGARHRRRSCARPAARHLALRRHRHRRRQFSWPPLRWPP